MNDMTKEKKTHTKKYTLTLSEREAVRLGLYADRSGISRPQALRELGQMPNCDRDEKQLGLFDTLQIDIFNNTAVVNNKE